MLTRTQMGMMYHCMEKRVRKLVTFFVTINNKTYDDIIKFINEAYSEEGKYHEKTSGEINLREAIPIIKDESGSMFNPNFRTLEKLYIINGPRCERKINLEQFKKTRNEFRKCAIDVLDRTINHIPNLRARRKNFMVFSGKKN